MLVPKEKLSNALRMDTSVVVVEDGWKRVVEWLDQCGEGKH